MTQDRHDTPQFYRPTITTPPTGSEFDDMGPKEAVIYMAEQLKALVERVIYVEVAVGGAAAHADRGANIAENTREELRLLVAAVDNISAAVFQLQPLPAQVADVNRHVVKLLGDVQAIYVRLASVERAAASAAFTAGKAWQGISELRVENANTGKAIFELMASYKTSQSEVASLKERVALAERRAEEASEQGEEADEWIANTGKQLLSAQARRASWGEEMLEEQLRLEQAKRRAEAKLAEAAAEAEAKRMRDRAEQEAKDAEERRAEQASKREHRNKIIGGAVLFLTAGAGTIWAIAAQNCGG